MPYIKMKSCFLCPERSNSGIGNDGLPISYAANTAGVGRTTRNRGPFAPSSKPIKLDDMPTPEQVIAICEVQNTTSPGFDIDDPFFGPCRQVLFAGHATRSNYVLLDGHAISVLRPLDTIPGSAERSTDAVNAWYLDGSKPLSDNGMRILEKTEKVFGGAGH
jgi:prepilin-type processing-associated H-X9-DG protein